MAKLGIFVSLVVSALVAVVVGLPTTQSPAVVGPSATQKPVAVAPSVTQKPVVTGPPTTQKPSFEDIWTKDHLETSRTCRGRLPNKLDGDDLKFFESLSKAAYMKYIDQVFSFRILDTVLANQHLEERPISELRCLFESPCMMAKAVAQRNMTLYFCTGAEVSFDSRFEDGIFDGVIRDLYGKARLTLTGVPTFTDRKSFVTLIFCFSDGALGFLVITNRPGLSAYSRHIIHEHLENSGFKDHFRISTGYMSSTCKTKINSKLPIYRPPIVKMVDYPDIDYSEETTDVPNEMRGSN